MQPFHTIDVYEMCGEVVLSQGVILSAHCDAVSPFASFSLRIWFSSLRGFTHCVFFSLLRGFPFFVVLPILREFPFRVGRARVLRSDGTESDKLHNKMI